ncbi:MAG: ATP-dependent sacrificial sulfur transferase LarE [Candidatus Saccharicenans sp.]
MKVSERSRKEKYLPLPPSVGKKYRELRKILGSVGSGLVALSGGVDSSLLLTVAREVLGDRLKAVIFTGPLFPEEETKAAENICRKLRVSHVKIKSDYWQTEEFRKNTPDRCYHCKLAMFSRLKKMAEDFGLAEVLEGSNLDDDLDYRPGQRALKQLGIRSPLYEAGFRKKEIRLLARHLGLPNWDRPSRACLASRIPHYQPVELEKLKRIARAENFLARAGFSQVRVRDHDQVARIEIMPAEFERFLSESLISRVSNYLHKLGWKFVALDLDGYRTGSLNPQEKKRKINNKQN